MMRFVAALLAVAVALLPIVPPAVASDAPAAEPFPAVPLPAPPPRSTAVSWIALGAGAGMLATSFVVHDRANRSYGDYLTSTDPDRLDRLYDRAVLLDRVSGASLITGEVLLATGIYFRFLQTPRPARVALWIGPGRAAAQWRF